MSDSNQETRRLSVADSPTLYVIDPRTGYKPASPSEILSAARALEGAEVVSPHIAEGDGPYTANIHLEPGRYVVIPLTAALGLTEEEKETRCSTR